MSFSLPPDLHSMLTYKRPHLSASEAEWITRFLTPHKPSVFGKDGEGALSIEVLMPDGSLPRTLFSAHTDTMHHGTGRQPVKIDGDWIVTMVDDCLGADDGAGAWILLRMIAAGVPGVYLFHRGEERGGVGSRYMAANHREWLSTFKRAVAFDRRGVTDVITHQRGRQRCASDAFGLALADALNAADDTFVYAPCDGGVFTDTANYMSIIPECTNISVGYEHEHGPAERQYIPHLLRLADACCKIDWEALPVVRDPAVRDTVPWPSSSGFRSSLLGGQRKYDLFDDYPDVEPPANGWRSTYVRPDTAEGLRDMSYIDMLDFVDDDPALFVDYVRELLGMDAGSIDEDSDDTDDTVPSDQGRLPHGLM